MADISLEATPTLGTALFLLASVVSLLLSHLQLYLHRALLASHPLSTTCMSCLERQGANYQSCFTGGVQQKNCTEVFIGSECVPSRAVHADCIACAGRVAASTNCSGDATAAAADYCAPGLSPLHRETRTVYHVTPSAYPSQPINMNTGDACVAFRSAPPE